MRRKIVMNRLLYILCLVVFPLLMRAQSPMSELYKQWMAEDINRGYYEKAVADMTHIEEWSYDGQNKKLNFHPDSAIVFIEYVRSLSIQSALRDSVTFYVAKWLCGYGYYYFRHYRIDESEKYLLKALEMLRLAQKEQDEYYAIVAYKLGCLYQGTGEHRQAEPLILSALDIEKNLYGEQDDRYIEVIEVLGFLYGGDRRYQQAEDAFRHILSVLEKRGSTNTSNYAITLTYLGWIYGLQNNYSKAEELYKQALNILGDQNPASILTLRRLGEQYTNTNDFQKAEQYLMKALELQEAIGYDDDGDIQVITAVGEYYHDIGQYEIAEKYMLQALELIRTITGERNFNYLYKLSELGELYGDMENYSKAEEYNMLTLEKLKAIEGYESQPLYRLILCQIADINKHIFNYPKAEEYYLLALKAHERDSIDSNYGSTLDGIASMYDEIGDYQKAEAYYLRALEAKKNVYGEQHHDVATILGNLGNLYANIGDSQKAEQYYLQALEIYKNLFGENHVRYAHILHCMGTTYYDQEDIQKAKQYFKRAADIQKAVNGEQNTDYAYSLNSLAHVYMAEGDTLKAEEYYKQALQINQSVLGEMNEGYAFVLSGLGNLYREKKQYAQAEECKKKALEIRKSIFGPQSPSYASALIGLGWVYAAQKDYAKAEPYLQEETSIVKTRYIQSLDYMGERQRERYWETMRWSFEENNTIFSYSYYPYKPSISSFAYDNELFVKGLLLTSTNIIRKSILDSGDSVLILRWDEMTEKKQQLLTLEEKGGSQPMVEQLRTEVEQLEKDITMSSAVYRENQRQWQITWDSVRNALKPNQVAIEYMSAPLLDDSTMYCALLIRDTCSYPILIPLFEEKEVTQLVNTSSPSATDSTYQYAYNGSFLSQVIWEPVQSYIHPGEVVFISPTGILHQMAIEHLPYDETRTIEDMYNVVRLSSTREIVSGRQPIPHQTATLYGGIRYSATPEDLEVAHAQYEDMVAEPEWTIASSQQRAMGMRAKDLPFTEKEVMEIEQLLKAHQMQVQVYSAKNANEESFKVLSGTHQNILHIATHGFFWSDSTAQKQHYFSSRLTMGGEQNAAYIDPLDRCGLLFAGANTALAGHSQRLKKGVQDGILTAKEISTMDLRDADIVVLSACETAIGDISGEGVFGLQRAFKMAGARTIVMALWKVDDDATRMLMTAFYRYYSEGQSKREAFRHAQQEVRKIKAEPYYWAGFIVLD